MGMQNCNLHNLPENYTMRYCTWCNSHRLLPRLVVAPAVVRRGRREGEDCGVHPRQDVRGATHTRDEDPADGIPNGHVTSISVLRSHRRLGLANKLMTLSQTAMRDTFNAQYVSLHVRETNRAAISLYHETLGFQIHGVEHKYYADGENALAMRLQLQGTA